MFAVKNLEIRPARAPDAVSRQAPSATRSRAERARLFGIDRLPAPRPLVCHWRRGPDGRLASFWEPDLPPPLAAPTTAAAAACEREKTRVGD